ncbi:MAG: hypothetical protein CR217_18940, partial [Beijerinckiaceae bacterium]
PIELAALLRTTKGLKAEDIARLRMGERDENLARPGAGDPHVILHDRIAAGKPAFDPQPFENPTISALKSCARSSRAVNPTR